MTEPPPSGRVELRRSLGPFSATCVVIGAIVGVGIFFTPSKVAGETGDSGLALLAWVAGGLIALLGALSFAELGARTDRSGGQYEVVRQAYGRPLAFVFVVCNATAIQAGAIAIIALICADNLGIAFTAEVPGPDARVTIGALLIGAVTLANFVGVKAGATLQNVTVVAKMATLLLITALAFWFSSTDSAEAAIAHPSVDSDVSWEAGAFCAALVPVFFSFGGWQHALWIGGEVRDPIRIVPRAIVIGVIVVLTGYLLVNHAYFALLGQSGVATSGAVAADAVQQVWPHRGARLIAGAIAFSAFGVLNAQLLSGPRLIYAMARRGEFFRMFGSVQPRFAVPGNAILLLGGMGLALTFAGTIDQLLAGVVLLDGSFMALTGAAVLLLRKQHPGGGTLRVWTWIPVLFVAGAVSVVVGAVLFQGGPDAKPGEQLRSVLTAGAWAAGAVLLYFACFRTKQSSTN